MSTHGALEAILLMATEPTTTQELAAALDLTVDEADRSLDEIAAFYEENGRGIRLRRIAGGWRFATDPALADVLEAWLVSDQRSRLTQAALETLSVIAYLQPVTRGRISGVRGVGVDGVVKTLLVRGLITEAGEDPVTGAMTFATTPLFLQKLGLNSLKELPDLAPMLPDAVALEAELGQLAAAMAPEARPEEEREDERPA
ncbi:SMC-Scp complex subunit ScpB [Tessaracoccus sp. Y36]|uniref:SMC-Scp complex subunit ScpB n=1 Tax=Tessaracoccus sp. ZS01 TaxID=1906324 RepID=UPI00096FB8C3|nr:SMC-Scp complex subunit ScpB [Tessaracoccus sp. ZS01]MCG6568353.1 SMC-Scp complex subunit ScpB [Tessaracoccus sp. ZS01]OMG53320.1 SMC-Scp complex subunit ScpB [Tessaracoccus sp. ZS01]